MVAAVNNLSIQVLPTIGNVWGNFGRPYFTCLQLQFSTIYFNDPIIIAFEGLYNDM